MERTELDNLVENIQSEVITKNTHFFICEDEVDTIHVNIGWSNDIAPIRDHFLYLFVLGNMALYNSEKRIDKISSDFILSIYNEKVVLADKMTGKEKTFFEMFNNVEECENYDEFDIESHKLCNYLNSLGYNLKFTLYKNPEKALNRILELDQYLPEGEEGFGAFLKECLENEFDEDFINEYYC